MAEIQRRQFLDAAEGIETVNWINYNRGIPLNPSDDQLKLLGSRYEDSIGSVSRF